ncbi:uncharacterized protein [Cicer arietinum]|uniref:Uncharacterized protein LOC113784185 n=1 Tax=Cicer arietinum TaxID=3827 RepID=A0A3Q7YB07_CICAR|nr:uncharacterized protein LOC113784185 [Cicer arietinum]
MELDLLELHVDLENSKTKGFSKSDTNDSKVITCYECGKTGHIRSEWYKLQNKNKPVKTKGKDQQPSSKRAYIAWNDNDEDSSDDSEDEEANLCLMANTDSESDNEVSTTSNPSYDELHDAFNELHTEYVSVLKQLISTKKLLEQKCMLYDEINLKHESLRDINEELKKEACALKCDVAKFNSGKNNLDRLLRSQRNLNVKTGLGYKQHMHVKGHQKFVKSKQMHDNFTGPNLKSSPAVDLKHNLLSISQLCDKGFKVHFTSMSCTLEHKEVKGMKLTGKRVNNIYMIDFDSLPANDICCLLSNADENWLWHKRVAHIHMDHLNRLVRKQLVLGLPNRKFSKDRLEALEGTYMGMCW